MTGLETAIILIAFIIVASTFAFTILNLGFKTAQKSGQVVQNGLVQSSSSVELDGAVVAYGNAANTSVTHVTFIVQLSAGAQALDLSAGKLTVSYSSADKYVANAYANSTAGVQVTQVVGNGNRLVESGETFEVTTWVNGTSIGDTLGPYAQFTIELKPTEGAVLTIARELPGDITPVIDLN